MPRPQVVMASANPDKVAEIAVLMADVFAILPRPADLSDVVEDAPTLEGNARLKAHAVMEATGLPAIADDTGLEIDHLDGAPGVFTARFAGENATYADNVAKTLAVLSDVPPINRGATFRTVALLAYPDGTEIVAHGVVHGKITRHRAGDGGFGYDPIFAPAEANGLTFAQMDPAAKHAISHRGRAFRQLLQRIPRND
ncbi:MAG: RdgB/HAM1 family non-canonical purine NTP pyrophosphatase [Acidimicrobiales bacterium]|nr:RdgB/HAM1 family non-canonical purine NTP pyrophosphatase [Acidimicrobiales bacterium]RZV44833.1 MAG: RdgB/HAM1 family non-canonical purine NTP pyrophosphatase [Acidimicrobiales bacterium]